MSTEKRVFSRLFDADKRKQNLSREQRVALSLVGDIENEYSWLEQSYSEASYGVEFMQEWVDKIMDFNTELSIAVDNYVVNGSAYSFEEAYTNMQARIEELDAKANELGIDPSDLVANYSEIKDILSNADSVNTEFKNAYKEVLDQANNKFGLADFS